MTCEACPHRIEIPANDADHQAFVYRAQLAIMLLHGDGEHRFTVVFPPFSMVRIGPEALAALEAPVEPDE